jgi:hypothetical protein
MCCSKLWQTFTNIYCLFFGQFAGCISAISMSFDLNYSYYFSNLGLLVLDLYIVTSKSIPYIWVFLIP